jgi:molybdopterin/thiamine biosynthesis adenylyltransferase
VLTCSVDYSANQTDLQLVRGEAMDPIVKTAASRRGDGFVKASGFYPAAFDPQAYEVRTARNHSWIAGIEGQEAIRKLSIGVAGMGGMGSNIAQALVRLGVGHLRITDLDRIEPTNLNRQVIAVRDTVGKTKVEAGVQLLRAIAEDYELVTYEQGVEPGMVEEFVTGCNAIADEIDVYQLEAHVMLHRAARARRIPLYSAYAIGFGIHFYKFEGDGYTFEDFLGNRPSDWHKPTAEFLFDRIGRPLPSYVTPDRVAQLADQVSKGGTPIFGPTTLIGHSTVAIRMILDLLMSEGFAPGRLGGATPTPVMPEFMVLDLADMKLDVVRVPNT